MYTAGPYCGWRLRSTRAIWQLFRSCFKPFIYCSNISIGIQTYVLKIRENFSSLLWQSYMKFASFFITNWKANLTNFPHLFIPKLLKIEGGKRNERRGIDRASVSRLNPWNWNSDKAGRIFFFVLFSQQRRIIILWNGCELR